MRKIFVSGIGTDVGKTVVSAILCKGLRADYWKPIQSGDFAPTDRERVQLLLPETKTHKEQWLLKKPVSPHEAAALENIRINLQELIIPETKNTLIIEGAGGLMVPLNDEELIIDMIIKTDAEVVLVSSNYLGSINHTLLSAEVLRSRGIKVTGIIFNGSENNATEEAIQNFSGLPVLGRIGKEVKIDQQVIEKYANRFTGI